MARILFLDEDREVREVLAEFLADEGHTVILASDGGEGVRLHRAWNAEVIVMTMRMPPRGSLESLTQLVQEFPGVKIISISGDAGLLSEAKSRGAVEVFRKPVDPSAVAETIRRLVAGNHGSRGRDAA